MWGYVGSISVARRKSISVVLLPHQCKPTFTLKIYWVLTLDKLLTFAGKDQSNKLSILLSIWCSFLLSLYLSSIFCTWMKDMYICVWVFWKCAEGLCVTSSWHWMKWLTRCLWRLCTQQACNTHNGQTRSELSTQAEVLRNQKLHLLSSWQGHGIDSKRGLCCHLFSFQITSQL